MIVKYSKKFTTGPWLNEDIGFEIELEDTEGKPLPEAIQITLGFLKQMAEKFHKDNNPQLVEPMQFEEVPINKPIPSIDYRAKEKLEIDIDNAESVVELEGYYSEASRMGLQDHYYSKMMKFVKGTME